LQTPHKVCRAKFQYPIYETIVLFMKQGIAGKLQLINNPRNLSAL